MARIECTPGGKGLGRSCPGMSVAASLRERGCGARFCGGVAASSVCSFRRATAFPAPSLRHVVPGSTREGMGTPSASWSGYRSLPQDVPILKREGPNRAVIGHPMTCRDVHVFHRRLDGFFDHLRERNSRGNKEALSSIEQSITRAGPTVQGRPASPAAPSLTRAMASYG